MVKLKYCLSSLGICDVYGISNAVSLFDKKCGL